MTALHGALVLTRRGRLLASWFGAPILVLETRGRHTNTPRATPLVYLPHGNGFAVVPANAGAERPPAWWLNLQAAGEGVVVLGGRRQPITPALASGDERTRLWRRMCAIAPVEHYQRRTSRTLRVVVLSRHGRPARRGVSSATGPERRRLHRIIPWCGPALHPGRVEEAEHEDDGKRAAARLP